MKLDFQMLQLSPTVLFHHFTVNTEVTVERNGNLIGILVRTKVEIITFKRTLPNKQEK